MKKHHLLAAALAVLASAAGAQTLKPGLWQVTHNMQTGSGQMEQSMAQMRKEMAGMPPEQRKMMEDMMARQGVKPGAGGGMSMKICMTRDMVEKNEVPMREGDCKTTSQSRSGNTMKMAFSCSNPAATGESQVTFISPEAYTMKMAVATKVDGKPEKMNMEGSGKWLGADCGKVKPHGAPKK
jgi:uncharacterized protein DUF3617